MKNQFEDSGDDYEMDLHNNGRGRIIFLGDGTEPLNEGDEEEEDKDVEMQADSEESAKVDRGRNEREETPGPEPQKPVEALRNSGSTDKEHIGTPASTTHENSNPTTTAGIPLKAVPESALPDKIIPPPASQEK